MTHLLTRGNSMLINIIISFLLIANFSWAISLDEFYPFGTNENDQELKPSDYFSGFSTNISGNFTFRFTHIQTVFVRCWSKNTYVASVCMCIKSYLLECAKPIELFNIDTYGHMVLSG